jgi:hypothetical protein
MNKQSSKSSRSTTSMGAPAGRASFARLVSSLILALSALAGLFSPQRGGDGGVLPPLRTLALPISAWGIAEHAMHELPGCRDISKAAKP